MSNITFDTSQFLKGLSLYDSKVHALAKKAMRDNGNDLLKNAKQLVAKDEGTLERSGHVRHIDEPGAIEEQVTFNTPYANKVHEEMIPAPGAKIRPGETTRAKPATEFGPAGGQYLLRALTGKARRYIENVANKIKAGT